MSKPRELFVISQAVVRACGGTDPAELTQIVAEMIEFGIFRLPYDSIDLRFVSDTGTTLIEIHDLQLAHVPKPEEVPLLFIPGLGTRTISAGEMTYWHPSYNFSHKGEGYEAAVGMMDLIAMDVIVALAVKNVQKRTVTNKRAKLGIGKKANRRYDSITYIETPFENAGEHASGHAVRAHLRRGHSRSQHFGKGNANTKKVWIAPVFVNGDSEYVQRKAYVVGQGASAP